MSNKNSKPSWYTPEVELFMKSGYLRENQTIEEKINLICDRFEELTGLGKRESLYNAIVNGWVSLSTPVWANYGEIRGLPISCNGSNIDDSLESILETLSEIAVMTKNGAGTSAYFGNLRSRGASISDGGKTDGSVHFMQMFDNMVNSITQGSCYDDTTEVLTNNGFKLFKDINKSVDLIAEVDEYNNVDFINNYELVENNFSGQMVLFSSRKRDSSFSLKVTPNHRMVVNKLSRIKVGGKNSKKWRPTTEIIEAEKINLHRDNRIPISAYTKNKTHILSSLDKIAIAYQADGRKSKSTRQAEFHFSKLRKIERIKSLLEESGIQYQETKTLESGVMCSRIFYKEHSNTKIKYFNERFNLEDFSRESALEFINEILLWDGYKTKNIGNYSTIEKINVDFVQALCSICGLSASIYVSRNQYYHSFIYNVYICDKKYKRGNELKKELVNYEGKVYCAIVPDGRLIVRHNNRVSICGNTRRGAMAAYLDINHPDIEEFLKIRHEGSKIQDLSTGVCIPDSFMDAIITGDKEKRKIWAKLIQSRINTGYPYIFFTDNVNDNAPEVYQKMKINHSNLCSEITLFNDSSESFVCCLSSMNIAKYDEWKDTDTVEVMIYFLDSVITEYIEKGKNIKHMERAVRFSERHRALGLGWLGYHTYLQQNMIPFESMEAQLRNVEIAKLIYDKTKVATRFLAEKFGEPEVCKGFGIRNTTTMAIAPTKSSSTILGGGTLSEGIEPNKSNYMVKDTAKGKFTIKNKDLQKLLETYNKNTEEVWQQISKNFGSVQNLDFLSEKEKEVFKTFSEISMKEILIQAAARQNYIDQSQSLNLMVHEKITPKQISEMMIFAWEIGTKTLYYQIGVSAAQTFKNNLMDCKSCEG